MKKLMLLIVAALVLPGILVSTASAAPGRNRQTPDHRRAPAYETQRRQPPAWSNWFRSMKPWKFAMRWRAPQNHKPVRHPPAWGRRDDRNDRQHRGRH